MHCSVVEISKWRTEDYWQRLQRYVFNGRVRHTVSHKGTFVLMQLPTMKNNNGPSVETSSIKWLNSDLNYYSENQFQGLCANPSILVYLREWDGELDQRPWYKNLYGPCDINRWLEFSCCRPFDGVCLSNTENNSDHTSIPCFLHNEYQLHSIPVYVLLLYVQGTFF